jgi:two-component system, OmpR family, phosphate regulon sensor histidine kinase PhoR
VRSQTIRLGIFISTLIISAIIIFQLIWLRKVYNFEQREFDHRITRSIKGYYEDVHRNTDSFLILNDQIIRQNKETYLFKTEKPISPDSAAYFVRNELEEENILTGCYLGIYHPEAHKFVYAVYLEPDKGVVRRTFPMASVQEPFSYMALYFPYRNKYILGQMNFWLISSGLLLVVLLLFSGSLYYFYRQKFLNETQKDFVNNFTHEFKTPVSVINLAAEVLESPSIAQKPDRLSKYAAIVKYQGKYLQDQIERLLGYAYAEANHLHLKRNPVSLHNLIEVALNNLQPLVEEKQAHILSDLKAKKDRLAADQGYLLIVITNLLDNAIKYSKDPRVIISTYNENGQITLSIKDNGKGISKKHVDRIFDKFYRIPDGDQMSARGFGLGLSFVKRIVLAHHGKITVESIPGIGSNFIVKLPIS